MDNRREFLQHWIPFLVLISIAVQISGCSSRLTARSDQARFPEPGTVAIMSPINQPTADINELSPTGTANSTVTGGIAATVAGTFECLVFLYPFVPAYPLCLTVAATAGTVTGYDLAESPELVDSAQAAFIRILSGHDWQAVLRKNLVQAADRELSISIVDLGNRDPADMIKLNTKADTLIEVTLIKLSTWFSGDHKFGFVLTGRSRLIRSADMAEQAAITHQYVSTSVPLSEWVTNDGDLIRDSLATGLNYLAREIIHGHFN